MRQGSPRRSTRQARGRARLRQHDDLVAALRGERHPPSPFVACSFIAARTKRNRLGPASCSSHSPTTDPRRGDGAVFDVLVGRPLNFAWSRVPEGGVRRLRRDRKERGPRVREGTDHQEALERGPRDHDGSSEAEGRLAPARSPSEAEPAILDLGEWRGVRLAGSRRRLVRRSQAAHQHRQAYVGAFHEEYRKRRRDPNARRSASGASSTSPTRREGLGGSRRADARGVRDNLSWEHLSTTSGNILKPDRTDMSDYLVKDRFVVGGRRPSIQNSGSSTGGITHFVAHIQFVGLATGAREEIDAHPEREVAPHV